jgi:ParB-like chromosome segregation protein Spo0J
MSSSDRHITYVSVTSLKPFAGNARVHSKKQIKKLARSIERYGFNAPVLVGDDNEIIAGHARIEAAKLLGLEEVPCVYLSHLSPAERRAYVLADNKLALESTWNKELLAEELKVLMDTGFAVEDTGFSMAEADILLEEAEVIAEPKSAKARGEDKLPELRKVAVSRRGDVWQLGRHRLVCGDARSAEAHDALLGEEKVDLLFTAPPYNVAIERNVSGKGEVRHGEFAMASGEMSEEEFTAFLEVG